MIYTCSNNEGGYKNCKHCDLLGGVYLPRVI